MDIKDFCIEVHETAKEHGFWPEKGRNFAEAAMLINTELCEMVNAHRRLNIDGKDGVVEELADTWIRLADFTCGFLTDFCDGDTETALRGFLFYLRRKMEYNKTRPDKHGKEY